MKPLSGSLRRKIEALRRTHGNSSAPSWQLNIFRDREKMLGLIDGEQITRDPGPPSDVQPALAHASDGRYHVIFERDGMLYYMVSSPENTPRITWSAPEALFPGRAPDVDFDGTFATTGGLTTGDLLLVYEEPAGSIQFRRKSASGWSAPVAVGPGRSPSVVRAWADPPEVGSTDNGYAIFYESGAPPELAYRQSTDQGSTWSDESRLDRTVASENYPSGGAKRNPQACRLSDYNLGIVFEYDIGSSSDVYFLKTTNSGPENMFSNLAAPDETVAVGLRGYREYEFTLTNVSYGGQDDSRETVSPGLRGYRESDFQRRDIDAGEETVTVSAGGYRETDFTGSAP